MKGRLGGRKGEKSRANRTHHRSKRLLRMGLKSGYLLEEEHSLSWPCRSSRPRSAHTRLDSAESPSARVLSSVRALWQTRGQLRRPPTNLSASAASSTAEPCPTGESRDPPVRRLT